MRRTQRNKVLVIGAILMTMTINRLNPSSFVYAQQESVSSMEEISQAALESIENMEEIPRISYQSQLSGQIKLDRKEMKLPLEEWESVDIEIEEVYVRKANTLKEGDPVFKISTESMQRLLEYYNNRVDQADEKLEKEEITYELEKNKAEYDREQAKQNEEKAEIIKQTELQSLEDNLTYLGRQIETTSLKLESYTKILNENSYYEKYGISDMAQALADSKSLMEDAQKTLSKLQTELNKNPNSGSDTSSSVSSDTVQILENIVKQAEKNYALIQDQYNRSLSDYGRQVSDTQIIRRDLQDSLLSLQEEYNECKQENEQKSMDINKAYDLTILLSKNADARYDLTVEAMEDGKNEAKREVEKWTQIREQLYNMEDGIIYAPQDMIVSSFTYHNGDKIEQNRSLLTYDDTSVVTVTVQVPQQEIVEWNIGDSVMVEVEGYEQLFAGKVSTMDLGEAIQNKAGDIAYTATILVEQGEERLSAGLNATVLYGAILSDASSVQETEPSSEEPSSEELSFESMESSSEELSSEPVESSSEESSENIAQKSESESSEPSEGIVQERQMGVLEPFSRNNIFRKSIRKTVEKGFE